MGHKFFHQSCNGRTNIKMQYIFVHVIICTELYEWDSLKIIVELWLALNELEYIAHRYCTLVRKWTYFQKIPVRYSMILYQISALIGSS